ncbi:MAG: hypothetical protein AB7N71_13270 [Phycisphaerae bacterium]
MSDVALAQRINRATVSRPSLNTPSALTGRVGGTFTRTSGGSGLGSLGSGVSSGVNQAINPSSPSQIGFSRQAFGRGTLPPIASFPQLYNNTDIAGASYRYTPPPIRPSDRQIEQFSGLAATQSLLRDLGTPIRPFSLPPTSPIVIPDTPQSSYERFFDLVPPEEDNAGSRDPSAFRVVEIPSVADRMSTNLDASEARRQRAAFAEFKELTTPANQLDFERMAHTARLLEELKRTDRNDPMPCVLLAHIAFERGQRVFAITNLADAARRDPNLFVKDFNLAPYFGDEVFFEKQIRRIIQLSSAANNDPEALVIEAYFAMLDGDNTRAKNAIDQAEEIALVNSFARPVRRSGISVLIWAIRAAVQ